MRLRNAKILKNDVGDRRSIEALPDPLPKVLHKNARKRRSCSQLPNSVGECAGIIRIERQASYAISEHFRNSARPRANARCRDRSWPPAKQCRTLPWLPTRSASKEGKAHPSRAGIATCGAPPVQRRCPAVRSALAAPIAVRGQHARPPSEIAYPFDVGKHYRGPLRRSHCQLLEAGLERSNCSLAPQAATRPSSKSMTWSTSVHRTQWTSPHASGVASICARSTMPRIRLRTDVAIRRLSGPRPQAIGGAILVAAEPLIDREPVRGIERIEELLDGNQHQLGALVPPAAATNLQQHGSAARSLSAPARAV